MIHIGFTGTRHGMSPAQLTSVRDGLLTLAMHCYGPKNIVAHHGDCIGADEDFHGICREIGVNIHVHPPVFDALRAFCAGYDVISPAKPYAQRNRDIVDEATHMLAVPRNVCALEPRGRGGTWQTVALAERAKKPLVIVFGNGTTEGRW